MSYTPPAVSSYGLQSSSTGLAAIAVLAGSPLSPFVISLELIMCSRPEATYTQVVKLSSLFQQLDSALHHDPPIHHHLPSMHQ